MTPLRVALVHRYRWPDVRRGGERYVDDLAWYLEEAGHSVDVTTGGRPLLGRRFDVVHTFAPTGVLAGRLAGRRTVFTVLGHKRRRYFGRRELASAWAGARAAHTVTALSRSAAHVAEAVLGRTVETLSPGVRLDRFPPALGARTGPPRVLFASDASQRWKAVDVALAAFGHILEKHPDARFWLGGPGDHTWALEAIGSARDRVVAATDVLGVGAPDDVPRRYRDATVTVLVSAEEAFGLVPVESLASGTPVVVSDQGGLPEIVDDPSVGRIARHGDPTSTAQALLDAIDLARDPGTPARCAEHARRWGWREAAGPAHERLYRQLLG